MMTYFLDCPCNAKVFRFVSFPLKFVYTSTFLVEKGFQEFLQYNRSCNLLNLTRKWDETSSLRLVGSLTEYEIIVTTPWLGNHHFKLSIFNTDK